MSQQHLSAYARRRHRAESPCMSMFRNLDSKQYGGVHTLSNKKLSTPNILNQHATKLGPVKRMLADQRDCDLKLEPCVCRLGSTSSSTCHKKQRNRRRHNSTTVSQASKSAGTCWRRVPRRPAEDSPPSEFWRGKQGLTHVSTSLTSITETGAAGGLGYES